MSDELTIYQRLAARFEPGDHKTRKQGGRDLTYLPGRKVIGRLNDVLGFGWSFRVVSQGATDVEAWVLGELTATVDGVSVTRQQYGNQDLARGQHPTSDLFKGAATDALKKAATTLGVGLYLYDEDERREVEAEMRAEVERLAAEKRAPKAPAATPAAPPGTRANPSASTPTAGAAPTSSSTTATPAPTEPMTDEVDRAARMTGAPPKPEATRARWQRLVSEAERANLDTLGRVKAIDPKAVSEPQLRKYADQLEERLKGVRVA